MNNVIRRGFWCGILLIAGLIIPEEAAASTYRWQVDASGAWNDQGNWELVAGPLGAGYPNLAGDVAVIDEPFTAPRTITIPDALTITIGQLSVASDSASVIIARTGTGLLAFDNVGPAAVIQSNAAGGASPRPNVTTPIRLDADVTISGVIDISGIGEAGGPRGVTITGGDVQFVAANTYSGTTTVATGTLSTSAGVVAIRIPGPLVVGDGAGAAASASVVVYGDSIAHAAGVEVNADGELTVNGNASLSSRAHTIDSLTVRTGRVAVASGTLTVTDLTMEAGLVELTTSDAVLFLAGSVTATSTAAAGANILARTFPLRGTVSLLPGNHDFTIADGPADYDFAVTAANVTQSGGEAGLTKKGSGLMWWGVSGNYTGATVAADGTLEVAGNLSASTFQVAGGTLTGGGLIGPIVGDASTGTVAPGMIVAGTGVPGQMTSGSIAFASGTRFQVLILDVESQHNTGYDRLQVVGTVALGNALLDVITDAEVQEDGVFVIIRNDEDDPVLGTFKGLPEGSIVQTTAGPLTISYQGGDGNDVVLGHFTTVTYFLSEGATGTFFDEDVVIANPNTEPAPITVRFLEQGDVPISRNMVVPALSRVTLSLDQIPGLENGSSSVEVMSLESRPLAVERTMFWDGAHYGGHTASAVPRSEQRWLFAEGAQSSFFDTYLLLGNADGRHTHATVTFLRENEPPFVTEVEVPGRQRVTVHAGSYPELAGRSFGMKVESDVPLIAERALYFGSTPTRLWTGGHANAGSPVPAIEWFHAEGASGTFFNTFILIGNPQITPANVTLRFLLQDGGAPIELTKTIDAQGRLTVNPAAEGLPRLVNAAFSTVVTSDVPVVSERAMYWPTDVAFGEGHASSGALRSALTWALAEGRVGGPNAYTTYILLANPNEQDADVTVTFVRESGTPVEKSYTVPGNSRFNVDVGSMVTELQNESFGARIAVSNGVPIVVERSLYWNVDGIFWQGGTNALAAIMP